MLQRWCEQRPGLVAFTGQCAVHRGQLMRAQGAWAEALEPSSSWPGGGTPRPGRPGRSGWPTTRPARCTGCAATTRRRRRRTRAPATTASTRSPAWRCCGWRRDGPRRPSRRYAACWPRRPTPCTARGCCRRRSRCWSPPATSTTRARWPTSSTRSPRRSACPALLAAAAYSAGLVELDGRRSGRRAALPAQGGLAVGARVEDPYAAARVRVLTARALTALGDADSARRELEAARRVFADAGRRTRRRGGRPAARARTRRPTG